MRVRGHRFPKPEPAGRRRTGRGEAAEAAMPARVAPCRGVPRPGRAGRWLEGRARPAVRSAPAASRVAGGPPASGTAGAGCARPAGRRREFCHLRFGEQVAQLRGRGGGARHQSGQPGEAAAAAAIGGRGRSGRAGCRADAGDAAGPAAAPDAGGEAGEAAGDAMQARPEQTDQRRGEPPGGPPRQRPAQPGDEAGEAVGRGGRSGWVHPPYEVSVSRLRSLIAGRQLRVGADEMPSHLRLSAGPTCQTGLPSRGS